MTVSATVKLYDELMRNKAWKYLNNDR